MKYIIEKIIEPSPIYEKEDFKIKLKVAKEEVQYVSEFTYLNNELPRNILGG